MRSFQVSVLSASTFGLIRAATLEDVCTTSYVASNIPEDGSLLGTTIDVASLTAQPVYNQSASDASNTFDFCDVSFAYSHKGRNDTVQLKYWFPAPADFSNRYLSTGGDGWDINTPNNQSLSGGVELGAVTGLTDGGFGGFTIGSDEVWLLADGTINWQTIHMLGHQGIYELGLIGKALTRNFYNMSDTKLYSYFQGCSEGGREGLSQVQRYGDELDGVVVGAPGLRFSFQNINHLWSSFVEHQQDYYSPYCELEKIVNLTIAACDSLDGRADGVVSRTDLCQSEFVLNSTIGAPYSCSATAKIPSFFPEVPAQNGSVTARGVAVVQGILGGARDEQGRRIYLSCQPSALVQDAVTSYNSTTGKYGVYWNDMSAEYIPLGLQLLMNTSLDSWDGITGDTFRDWILKGWQTYGDVLESTWPDLTLFQESGGKVIHYHGESDPQVPTASSVRYYDSVRDIMYPGMSYNASSEALKDWYRLFLVPGAGHCGANSLQPNGPFPTSLLATLIAWVENQSVPNTLNGTVQSGANEGDIQPICAWPLRPYWTKNGTQLDCRYDQASLDTWMYVFDAIKMPVY